MSICLYVSVSTGWDDIKTLTMSHTRHTKRIIPLLQAPIANLWWKQHLTTYQTLVAFVILARQVYSAIVIKRVGSEFNWQLSIITTMFFSLVLVVYSSTYLELYVNIDHCD